MKKRLLLFCGFLALAATVALATVLGMVGTGKAASTNTCTQLNPQSATCFVVSAPLYVTSGQIGLATGSFKPVGTATSTHTVMTLTLPGVASVVTNGISTSRPATCSQSGQTITCSFNNVQSGAIARMFVQFTASGSDPQVVSGGLTFAEGNGGTNDTFTASSAFESVSGADKAGYCTNDKTKVVKNKLVPLLDTVGTTGQTATINSLQTLASTPGIPCTPLAAAVVNDPGRMCGPKPCTTQKSIVQFAANGTVTILIPGTDAANFILYEISIKDGQTAIELNDCSNPPNPLTDLANETDSCIVSQTPVTKNGTKYIQIVLAVFGTPLDGGYIGRPTT